MFKMRKDTFKKFACSKHFNKKWSCKNLDAEIVHIALSLLRNEQLVRSFSVENSKISSPAEPSSLVVNDPREDSLLEELHTLAVPALSQI
jgi:hypothetical protein